MVEESVVKPLSGTNNTLECSVCCGHEFFAIDDIFDDRYGHPDLFQLVRCESCGHMMTSPMLKEGELPELYGTYYTRENISVA